MARDFLTRVAALRELWLSALERDAEDLKPTYEMDNKESRFEWSEWRLALIRAIAEATQIIGDRGSQTVHSFAAELNEEG